MNPSKPIEIVSHTSLRGLAALGVAVVHYGFMFSDEARASWYGRIVFDFHTMVDLFFILSGFVMCYVYYDVFQTKIKARDVVSFLQTRIARLYPLMLLTMAAAWIINSRADGFVPYTTGEIMANLLLMATWFPDTRSIHSVSWSISAEWAVYLLFPVFVMLTRKTAGRAVLLAVAVVAYAVVYYMVGALSLFDNLGYLRSIPGFIVGMFAFLWRKSFDRLGDGLLTLIQLAAFVGLGTVMSFELSEFLLPPLFAILLIVTASDRGLVARALTFRPFHLLGVWSYSIYMTHTLVLLVAWFVLARLEQVLSIPDVLVGLICLVVCVAVSALSYRYIEVPGKVALLKWMRR